MTSCSKLDVELHCFNFDFVKNYKTVKVNQVNDFTLFTFYLKLISVGEALKLSLLNIMSLSRGAGVLNTFYSNIKSVIYIYMHVHG